MALRRVKENPSQAQEAPAQAPAAAAPASPREILRELLWRYANNDLQGYTTCRASLLAALQQWPLLVPFRYADNAAEEVQAIHLSPGGAVLVEGLVSQASGGFRSLDAQGKPAPNPQTWPTPDQLFPGAEGYVFSLGAGTVRKMLPLSGTGADGVSFFMGFTGMDTLTEAIHLEDRLTHIAVFSYEELAELSRRNGCHGVVLDPDRETHCFLWT